MRAAAALAAFAAIALAGGCAPALRAFPPGGAGTLGDAPSWAAEVHSLARKVEHEPDAARRAVLATEAVTAGQRCEEAAPDTAACDYALGIALGLQARERPSTVREGLGRMAALLRRAAAADPALDHAGPDRVLSLLLLRAPGWPLGPGDVEEGLSAARRAVAEAPDYAPNELALAEALQRSEDRAGAHAAAERALRLADEAAAAGQPDAADWRRQAAALLDGR